MSHLFNAAITHTYDLYTGVEEKRWDKYQYQVRLVSHELL
jgi:hypothetical protein